MLETQQTVGAPFGRTEAVSENCGYQPLLACSGGRALWRWMLIKDQLHFAQ